MQGLWDALNLHDILYLLNQVFYMQLCMSVF